MSSVRPSVRLSVTLVNCDHIGWKSSKIISPSVSLACSLLATQTSRSTPRGTPWNFRPNRGGPAGCWKSGFRRTKPLISLKRGKIGPRLLWSRIGSHTRAFDWCQNQWPWMTLEGHYALCFKTRASFGAHCENLNEDRSIQSATKM